MKQEQQLIDIFPMKYDDAKQQKEKDDIKEYWDEFITTFSKELNEFSFAFAGTALTLYRDGYMDDTDIDMGVFWEDLPKLWKFIKNNNFKLGTFYYRDGRLTEIKIKLPQANVDFFVIHKNKPLGLIGGCVWLGAFSRPKLVEEFILLENSSDLKIEKMHGLMIPTNEELYLNMYGKDWNIKISKRQDYINSKEFSSLKTRRYITENIDRKLNYGVKSLKKKMKIINDGLKKI